MTEVVGLFDSRAEAEMAVDRLYGMGYDAGRVGFLDRQRDEGGQVVTDGNDEYGRSAADHDDTGTTSEEAAKGAAGGAVGGAAVGAGAGLLASAGMLLIPGIGPFLAAGTLAGTLAATAAGAAGGAALGGVAGAIMGASTDDETSAHYRQGVDRGDSLVTVTVMEGQENEAADQLRMAGASKVDIHDGSGWAV